MLLYRECVIYVVVLLVAGSCEPSWKCDGKAS